MTIVRDKFDFDIGYLIKSPCRECENRNRRFPDCIRGCGVLGEVQTELARGISCSRSYPAVEAYGLCLQGWDEN